MQAGPRYREGSMPDRARRVVSGTRVHPALYPPTPAPVGLPGPASLVQVWVPRAACRLGTPPVYPTPIPTRIPVLARTPHRTRGSERCTGWSEQQFRTRRRRT